jgi:phospholipid/cholesterol/gamma-HCH transport system permease protein
MSSVSQGHFPASLELLGPANGVLTIKLQGEWAGSGESISRASDDLLEVIGNAAGADASDGSVQCVNLDGSELTSWDSRILVAITAACKLAGRQQLQMNLEGLPDGIGALMRLSQAVPPRGEQRSSRVDTGFLPLVGESALKVGKSLSDGTEFLGQSILSFWRFFRGEAQFLRSDFLEFLQVTGPQALGIVGIINVLLGVILGFMGAVQLQQFGAGIYVADLVALGQTREIAPMMTGIVMAGRTGAAYAAQLGTMQVNEEIDALKTFGFSPMDFLVLPRMLALAIMFPILVLYADALGIFGGYLVGVGVLDLSSTE